MPERSEWMSSDRVIMARAVAHAAARGALTRLRERRVHPRAATVTGRQATAADGRVVLLQPVTGRRSGAPHGVDALVVSCAGERLGELWTRADPGTGTVEIVARLDMSTDVATDAGHSADSVLRPALRVVLDEVAATSPDVRIAVRRSLDPLVRGPGPELLTALGLTHVATFPGDVASPRAWPGEERWELLP